MINIKHILNLFLYNFDPLRLNPEYKKEFFENILLTNIKRLRFWSYFLIIASSWFIYADFFMSNLWTNNQRSVFIILDLLLAFFAISIYIFSSFFAPNDETKIKPAHKIFLASYFIIQINWCSLVAATENASSIGLPTYIIGIFSAATLMFFTNGFFIILLLSSLLTLYFFLNFLDINNSKIFSEYFAIIMLSLIAWLISRNLLATRMNTYIATRKLEEINQTLDIKVKERTKALSQSNTQLLKEIKERKKYESELQDAFIKIEAIDKLKTVFLANMSHEIRTPLNGILGFTDLLRKGNITPDRLERYLDIIYNSGQQLLRIIDDILDISLIESNQLKMTEIEFSLNSKIDETFEFFQSFKKTIGKDTIFVFSEKYFDDGKDTIVTDPFRLQQILNNLLRNAFKFTYEGNITIGYKLVHDMLLFYIQDTGIGVDGYLDDVIFERFRQGEESLKRSFGGNGLGLPICKGIVEKLGGKIWYDKNIEIGSRFCFTIPYKPNNNLKKSLIKRHNTFKN